MTAADFRTSIDRLLSHVGHWEQSRWAHPPAKAGIVYDLVQHLADLSADAEGRPRRRVPRMSDLILVDQLRVMADDLLLAPAPAETLGDARTAVDEVRHALQP